VAAGTVVFLAAAFVVAVVAVVAAVGYGAVPWNLKKEQRNIKY
jgi:hypothetical protein